MRPTSAVAPCTRRSNAEEKKREAGKDPYARKKGESDAVAAWRSRMRTEAASEYTGCEAKRRSGSTLQPPTADSGSYQFAAKRGAGGALLFAIAHELVVAQRLRQRKANRETDRQSVKTGQKSVRLLASLPSCSRIESGRRS